MILQALYEYYQRKAADPESGLAPQGFEWKEIPFLIVIDKEGNFVTIEDTRSGNVKKPRGREYRVPRTTARSGSKSYETTQFLWDHIGYVLNSPRSDNAADVKLANQQHTTWLRSLDALPRDLLALPSVAAVKKFYSSEQLPFVRSHPLWSECLKVPGCIVTFRVDGEPCPLPASQSVFDYLARPDLVSTEDARVVGRCLVTGELGPISRTHAKTAISKDSKALVSFQKNSGYDSYGKEQAHNAPVSVSAEFAYTTALTRLLSNPRTRLRLADMTVVFWAAESNDFEDQFPGFFTSPRRDDPDRDVEAVTHLYRSVHSGASSVSSPTNFFVLALAPSAFRISVRFWHRATVDQLSNRIRQHFDDLTIGTGLDEHFSLVGLLESIAPQGKSENIPPSLAGDVFRAVLEGTPYPATLLQQSLRRLRANQEAKNPHERLRVARMRAGILKAYLNRLQRLQHTNQKEITVSLDPDNTNPGYRLGRLFAVLEKIQEDASPGLNATIRDRYYGAASANPVTVFPQLLKLKNHHLKKLDNPSFVGAHEKRLREIFSGLPPDMPSHLRMEDQARFAIGYYHQRQALFTKAPKSIDETPAPEAKN